MKGLTLGLISLCLTSAVFADEDPFDASSKQCENIATACRNAGYTREQNKAFWRDCMKPVLLGKSVSDVKVDAGDVKACREFKITNMQKQIEEFKKLNQ